MLLLAGFLLNPGLEYAVMEGIADYIYTVEGEKVDGGGGEEAELKNSLANGGRK